ncbi:MAG: DUF1573 domain-containing protein [Planctomycetota bacterium]
MKAGLLLKVLVVVVLVLGAYWVGAREGNKHPSPPGEDSLPVEYIGFSPLEIDLGSQPWFAEVPFTATFINDSLDPVTIATLKSSCGCMAIDMSSYVNRIVESGERLAIEGELHIGAGLGQRSKEIELLLDSGIVYTVLLNYAAYSTYCVLPDHLDFGEVDLDDEADDAIASAVFSSETAQITAQPTVDLPWLEVGLNRRGERETEIIVRVAKRNLPYGKNFGKIRVTTDDPTHPQFTLSVRAEGSAQLRPVPSHVFLRLGETRKVGFITREGLTARLLSVSADNDSVVASVDEDGLAVSVSLKDDGLQDAVVVCVTTQRGLTSRFLVTHVSKGRTGN